MLVDQDHSSVSCPREFSQSNGSKVMQHMRHLDRNRKLDYCAYQRVYKNLFKSSKQPSGTSVQCSFSRSEIVP